MKEKIRKEKIILVIRFVPAIIIMMIIFYFSAAPATQSSQTSISLTESILDVVQQFFKIPDISIDLVNAIEGIIRKCAHALEYFGLAIVLFYAIYGIEKRKIVCALYTQISSSLYAVTDEIHQYFVPWRSPQMKENGRASCREGVLR